MDQYVVGVDGGTTKTIALVATDTGRIIGAARRGGSNYTGADVAIPMSVVIEAVRAALAQAGLCGEDVTLGMFCLAGADWPEDHERRQRVLQAADLARCAVVKNDAFAGLRAGTRDPYGIVIAAGTGTNTAVIAPDGSEWHFGYYANEGGGGRMAHAGIWAVLRADDGRGQPTLLTDLILDQLGYARPELLLRALVAKTVRNDHIAALCPLIFKAAWQGDAVATSILIEQGKFLAEYATALIRRYNMQHLAFDVVLSGSVFKGEGTLLVDTITQSIHAVAPRARIVQVAHEPAVGALLLAYDALGIAVAQPLMQNLIASTPAAAFFSTDRSADFTD